MTYFIKSGSIYRPTAEENLELFRYLPVGNYTVNYNKNQRFYYLEESPLFQVPYKLYGNVEPLCDRILTTYSARNTSMGVLLCGQKGSGKSLLAKFISVRSNKPTIIVNECFADGEFLSFIQSIDTESVIIFDEFEKHYERQEQNTILTLLDGTTVTRHLYVLTANEKRNINPYLLNRPSRVYYTVDYTEVDTLLLQEYIGEHLNNQDYAEELFTLMCSVNCNFDQLQSVVDEMNRYKESPQTAMKLMNIDPTHGVSPATYEIVSQTPGLEIVKPTRVSCTIHNFDELWINIDITVDGVRESIVIGNRYTETMSYQPDGIIFTGVTNNYNTPYKLYLQKVERTDNKFEGYQFSRGRSCGVISEVKVSAECYD